MKKVTKVEANGFYVFSGRSNANSCFIERLSHAKVFLIYANYFLKEYLTIHEYLINKDGWTMIVKIKSKNTILHFTNQTTHHIWKIISERVRLFISTFVRVTNKSKGRTGSLVHSEYERYYFDTLKESKEFIDKIRTQQIKFYSKKKYRGLKTHYKVPKKLGKGSIFLCSRDLKLIHRESHVLGEVFEFVDLPKLVTENLIKSTIIKHTPFNSMPTNTASPKNHHNSS